jgi:dienelactone hydrolase
MKRLPHMVSWIAVLICSAVALAADTDPTRVLAPGRLPQDRRLGKAKDLNGYFPLTVPGSKDQWDKRRREVREQVLVATGLWPMPERPPIQAVIHGKIVQDDYTIEKVFFASYPGHYVSGNLYRPKAQTGKLAGVLCPHGHWRNGRFYDAGEQEAANQIKQGAEKTTDGARYPLQARCAQLARMGCVVFHYDMVGVADSTQLEHTKGFTDAEAELRLQSFMGLQTFNSIRALDFLLSLPEVDGRRIGVTGASGGGTQTFILCAIDDRPTVAFPAVMVSTAMQGGCICENCSYLRQDTGNIELAGLFAPRPLGMSAAHDWTLEIETKGLPELKALYKLYGAEDRVMAKCYPEFQHNYNQVSRELMYNWFNRHLRLGQPEPVVERPFVPVPPKDLTVFDKDHPRPGDAGDVTALRQEMSRESDKQLAELHPKDGQTLARFRELLGTALRVMIHDQLPGFDAVESQIIEKENRDGIRVEKLVLGRKGQEEQVPALLLTPARPGGSLVVWIHPGGKSSLLRDGKFDSAAQQILNRGGAILAPDVLRTGESQGAASPVNAAYAGYTFGYNRPLLAERVHDILTAVAYARGLPHTETVSLAGWEKAGPWVVLARALCGEALARTVADVDQFRFDKVQATNDEMMLPGVIKYGGLPALAALCAPGELYLHNDGESGTGAFAEDAYRAAGKKDRLRTAPDKATAAEVVRWLLR